jgi:hypothetical protein
MSTTIRYEVFVSTGSGLCFRTEVFDNLEEARRTADLKPCRAHVRKVTTSVIHQNGRHGVDPAAPIRSALRVINQQQDT